MGLQGIRRVTALTGDKALLALREGQELSARFSAAAALTAAELDKEITSLKQVSHTEMGVLYLFLCCCSPHA